MTTELQQRFDTFLHSSFTQESETIAKVSKDLVHAMWYSLSNGGKRIRPLLVYGSAIATNGNLDTADDIAVALEMIHAYSLIHDDLPAMDDDDFRRGKPSCHIAHGDAMAILAGDALQALAFQRLVRSVRVLDSNTAFQIVDIISAASIAMVSGQALDIASVNQRLDEKTLQKMHIHKTGALISACVQVGSMCANGITDEYPSFQKIGNLLGLAYQIHDDLLDAHESRDASGELQNSDNNKSTYPAILGTEKSKQLCQSLHDQAYAEISCLSGDSAILKNLCTTLAGRKY